jgi:hypothetical protein
MIMVPAGFADGLAVGDAVGETPEGDAEPIVDEGAEAAVWADAGLNSGVDCGTEAVPQPAANTQSTTARLLIRQSLRRAR